LRHLGILRHEVKSENIKRSLLLEMMARTVKHKLRKALRIKTKELLCPFAVPHIAVIIEHLNLCFGSSTESVEFWKEIKLDLVNRFKKSLTPEEIKPSFELVQILNSSSSIVFINRLENMVGFKLESRVKADFMENPQLFAVKDPFDPTDLEELGEVVHTLNIIDSAQGYVLKTKAREQNRAGSSNRLAKMAITKFESVLSNDPKNAFALAHCADCHALLGNKTQAYDMYIKAITADPKEAEIALKFATLLFEEWVNYDQAEEYYLKALETDNHNVEALQKYGDFLTYQGLDTYAEKLYDKAAQISSKQQSRLFNIM